MQRRVETKKAAMLNSDNRLPDDLGHGPGQEADIVRRLFAGRLVVDCPFYLLGLDPDLVYWFDYESLIMAAPIIQIQMKASPELAWKLRSFITSHRNFSEEERAVLIGIFAPTLDV
ncbi:hypothetical protein [Aphanothece microscopica]|uniref:hypothetical protein n=1 Tax=Aphanothece microscopica TaxID=1049561 RepID=UPI00398536FF